MIGFLPEWQIQESLFENPKPLEVPGVVEGIRVRTEQRFLPSIGRYIDLLCRTRLPGGWLIVEIKAEPVIDDAPVRQALDYRHALAEELSLKEKEIGCMVAAPGTPSPGPELYSRASGVLIRQLELASLLNAGGRTRRDQFEVGLLGQRSLLTHRRDQSLSAARGQGEASPDGQSVRIWMQSAHHDEHGRAELARVLRHLSGTAPLFAHEVGGLPSTLDTPERQWFWLFYSSLDRRGNAALFVKGRDLLVREGLFEPEAIVEFVRQRGEAAARQGIASALGRAGVPLIVDLHYGRESLGQSVLDAARLVVKWHGFQDMIDRWGEQARETGEDLARLVVRNVQEAVYGMGPRSSAQFVRGMALKGPWRMRLTDRSFLEDTKYNGLFAGPARLKIVEEDYRSEAVDFADAYLDGNKGVLSHALWFIRKRYCDKVPLCGECPVAGYCAYFRRTLNLRKGSDSGFGPLGRGGRQLTLSGTR